MLMCSRRFVKPECISADSDLAWARSAGCDGHNLGFLSARYSRMARESHTVVEPSISTGTLPAGEAFRISAFVSGAWSGMRRSSKGNPNTFIAIHGRSDQDE